MWDGGDIFRDSVTNIGNFEEEYLMTRNIGNRGIFRIEKCGRSGRTVKTIAHPEMSPVCYNGAHF